MQERLKKYFQQVYQGQESFIDNVIFPIFGEECFENGYNQNVLKDHPVLLPTAQATGIDSIIYIGKIDIPFNSISVFDITVSSHILLSRNRVGIQQIIRRIIETYTSAFMIFHYQDNSCCDWRFTFCSKEKNNEITDNKRYTFMLGPNQSCRTVADNFSKLYSKERNIEIEDIKEAFNVEALSNEFFSKYKQHYEKFVMYITGKCFIKSSGKWKEKVEHEPNPQMYANFGKDDKQVRDYVKKLLGRIVFLHFLQKKGWLGVPQDKQWGEGDYQFMFHLFDKATEKQKDDFLDSVLEPLFNDLNTKRDNDLVSNCNVGLNIKVPYLNGGLFERDKLDEIKTHFPKEFFEDLFDFLSQYNFTIDENDPNDAEIGIDPEMLGRIFENLLEDNKDKGAFYTPKEIVQYMCRESLIAYLQTDTKDDNTKEQIRNFVTTYNIDYLSTDLKRTIDTKLRNVKICDPAIGSGAFPMGLLKELFFCRGAIENFDDSANIKRHIIQNNIYGVDIEKGAVDIARLRFWLSLVVDEQTPNTLPNLDFKIMQGNSLLEQYKGTDLSEVATEKKFLKAGTQRTLFDIDINNLRRELRDMLKEYYSLDNHTKKQKLLQDIKENITQQMKVASIDVNFEGIDMHANDQFFLWHTWFNDVFDKGGFDIVIGNPPYIDSETMSRNMPELREEYSHIYDCARGNWDIFILFIELAIQLCSQNGVFSYIIPNKLIASKYAETIRKMLSMLNLIEIRDYSSIPVFLNAAVYPITIIGSCNKFKRCNFIVMQDILNKKSSFVANSIDFSNCQYWDVFFKSPDIVELINKCLKNKTLKDVNNIEIIGAATVTESYKIKEILKDKQSLQESFKVINTGTIDPYTSLWGLSPMQYIKKRYNYPRIEKQDLLKINPRRVKQAESNKIIVAGMSKNIEAVYDFGEILAGKSTTIILYPNTDYLKVILALLNSKLISFLTSTIYDSIKMSAGYLNIGIREIESIPIPEMSKSSQQKLIELVDIIIAKKKENMLSDATTEETEINKLVYQLYDLTPEQIKIIEES